MAEIKEEEPKGISRRTDDQPGQAGEIPQNLLLAFLFLLGKCENTKPSVLVLGITDLITKSGNQREFKSTFFRCLHDL